MSNLYAREIPVNQYISVIVPSVGYVIDNEETYNDAIYSIVATPYDMMVALDDAGIDFSKINDFELFCLLFDRLKSLDTSQIFGSLDLTKFRHEVNNETGEWVLRDDENGIVIDKIIHTRICEIIRGILSIEHNDKKAGNEEARKYLIERERKKQRRQKNKPKTSQIETLIVSLVNTSEFPYNYETVRDITIYQLYASVKQVSHKIRYDHTMGGLYAGTIKFDDISQEDRTWIATLAK